MHPVHPNPMADGQTSQPALTASPIALFAFNRPDHLRRTLAGLMACDGFDMRRLTVFCDGPRHVQDEPSVAETRALARAVLGPDADLRCAPGNQGLAASIIAGVSELVARHGRVIVIEDDLDLAPCFLAFMDAALDRYADDTRVFQISGHMFDVPVLAQTKDALALPMTTTWGWATWARAWGAFDPAATGWQSLATDADLRLRFNLGGIYDYAAMMERQMEGKRNSWGVRWYWSVFRQNGYCVFPPVSLVRNTGQDGSGTHGSGVLRPKSMSDNRWPDCPVTAPLQIPPDPAAWNAMRGAIWKTNGGWKGWFVDIARRLLRR